jgi:hypothetical protein
MTPPIEFIDSTKRKEIIGNRQHIVDAGSLTMSRVLIRKKEIASRNNIDNEFVRVKEHIDH